MNINYDKGKDMANRLLQTKIKQKRNQNMEKLNQHLNKLNVAGLNRKQFYTSLNKNVNLNTVIKNANSFAVGLKEKKFRELMNKLNFLTEDNRFEIENKINGIVTNWGNLEKFATTRAIEREKQKIARNREDLIKYMNSINLNKNSQNQLLKNLDASTKNVEKLKNNASRKRILMAANNLSSQEKSNILNRFDKKNITLNFALKEINDIKTKKVIETKKAVERKELSNHLNGLNLNNTIKGEFLNKFDKSNGNVSALKNEATNRKSQIVATQRKANRNALSNFLDTINELNETNKKSILNKFDASNSESLNTIKIAAQNLQKRRIVEKRLKNRNDVSKYLNDLVPRGLTTNEKNTILKKFNNNVSISVNAIKKEASNALNLKIKTKIEANRKNLENFMSNLRISKENQNKILENFNASPNTIDNLKNRATKLNENRRRYEQNMKNVSNKVKQLTNLSNEERKEFLNRVNENGANKVIANASKLNANRKEEKRLENERRAKEQELKNVTAKLETLNNLDRNNRIKFIERLNSNGANKVIANATKLNTNRKEARRIKAEEEVKVREKLRTLTNLTNEERNLFMNKLETNGANKVIANASKLNINRKEIKKAQEEKNRKEREMKNVANKLQNFTNLTNENRKVFLNRLNENGANKVLTNANKLNTNRKEVKRLEEEKRVREQQLKNVSNKLQTLTNLTNENRKEFLNRLNENGANKVLTNANKLNANRKEVKRLEEEKRVKEQQLKNVSNKLQTLTNLTNEDRKKFLNRLNENGANKVLTNANKLNANRKEVKKNV